MTKKDSKLTMPNSLEIPMIKNVAELEKMKRPPRKPLLIHCTQKQWKQMSNGIKKGKAIPKKGFRMIGIPDPNGDIILRPECVPSGPDEECILKPIPRPGVPRAFGFQCMCRPTGFLEPLAEPPCTLELGFAPPRIYCRTGSCAGNCRLQIIWNSSGFGFTLVCVCH